MPRSVSSSILLYILTVIFVPTVITWGAFAVTCAIECTALPWASVVIGPGLSILVILAVGIVVWRKANQFAADARRTVRVTVLTSLLWGWPFAFLALIASLDIAAMF